MKNCSLRLAILVALGLAAASARGQTVITGTTTDNTNATALTISSGTSYILNAGTTYQIRSATDSFGIRLNKANVTLSIQGALETNAPLSADSDNSALRVTGAANSGIVVNVGGVANTAASILSKGNDAVKFTAVGTSTAAPNILNNYGTLRSEGRVNASSTVTTYTASDAVTLGINTTLNNYGLVSGARHGVDAGAVTGVVVNNYAGGSLIGRNGSGIGADTTSAVPANYTVNNWGLIRGDYAGPGNIYDRTNSASINGDGDGIDIDGATTITNYASGQILSTGAGGFDSGTRTNNSEAIAIGGGMVDNAGVIRGSGRGIIVNNDGNVDNTRSGSAALVLTNRATGTIEGQDGFAIRSENKTGTAADNDTITNNGTIIGNGTIPDPAAIVVRQDGNPDPGSVGTLNGVVYTGSGVARFIRGDGAAIQTGEGNDTVTNSGTITGNSGRAISLEGGNDALVIDGGSAAITGNIDGGVGVDSLTFSLGSGNAFAYAGVISKFETIAVNSGTVNLSGTMAFTLGGAVAGVGYDQVGLTLGNGAAFALGTGSLLAITLDFTPAEGTAFTLIDVAGTEALSGTFAGLAEGAQFTAGGQGFTISYVGGSGNDVVVTAVPEPGTWGLMLLGAGLLGGWNRRRRR